MNQANLGGDLVRCRGPGEWFGVVVPVCDVDVDGADKLTQRPEGSSPDGLFGDDAEPDFYLVEPGAAGRGEVEGDVRMAGEPLVDIGSGMGGQVVEDDVDSRPLWAATT